MRVCVTGKKVNGGIGRLINFPGILSGIGGISSFFNFQLKNLFEAKVNMAQAIILAVRSKLGMKVSIDSRTYHLTSVIILVGIRAAFNNNLVDNYCWACLPVENRSAVSLPNGNSNVTTSKGYIICTGRVLGSDTPSTQVRIAWQGCGHNTYSGCWIIAGALTKYRLPAKQ